MTSLLATAALTPLILALVPCLFLTSKSGLMPDDPPPARRDRHPDHAMPAADRTPWWKPTDLGIDNYS